MCVCWVWYCGDEVMDMEDVMIDEVMEVLKMAVLCIDVIVEKEGDELIVIGNLIEVVIVCVVEENYYIKEEFEEKYFCIGEIFFDLEWKMMIMVY